MIYIIDEIQMWKNKYEALAKLYSQLRKEHIELLNKYKQLQVKANSVQEATEKLERMEADMRAKNVELADLIRERDRARNELARIHEVSVVLSRWSQSEEILIQSKKNQRGDTERLQRELQESRNQIEELGKSKGAEVSALLARFNREKGDLESSLTEKQALIDEFLKQIEEQQGDADRVRRVSSCISNERWRPLTSLIGERWRNCCSSSWYGWLFAATERAPICKYYL